jgi:cellulose 1,4-beta-cellobiosidase
VGGFQSIGSTDPNSPEAAAEEAAKRNPFLGADFYLNPSYVASVEATAAKYPDMADKIRKVAKNPTAMWLDTISQISKLPEWLEGAKKQQEQTGKPTVAVFVVYDLPNRDCAANASAGELKLEQGGEARYKNEYIDPIAKLFSAYPNQRIIVVLEPDSLANLATNMALPKCAASKSAYMELVAYAIQKLSLPNVSIYLDAAHAGWLGWDGNRQEIARIFRKVMDMAGGQDRIRGFVSNVSNYTHLSNRDGAKLEPTNPCPNETTYAKKLRATMHLYGMKDKGILIDTSRNGRGNLRQKWGSWCNIQGAGLGERPQAAPQPGIDAYFWIKPPGESDGVSDPAAPRYDAECSSPNSARNAPQAGQWFESYFLDLVRNAEPPL